YRDRMIHAIESAGRSWHMAYTSPNLPGIQAAVSAGLGVSILPAVAILPDHRVLKRAEGFPRVTNTEVALNTAADASPATRSLAEVLAGCWAGNARGRWGVRLAGAGAGRLDRARPFGDLVFDERLQIGRRPPLGGNDRRADVLQPFLDRGHVHGRDRRRMKLLHDG